MDAKTTINMLLFHKAYPILVKLMAIGSITSSGYDDSIYDCLGYPELIKKLL